MTTNLVPESPEFFVCEKCDFSTSRKSHYKRHINTPKHEKNVNGLQKTTILGQKVPGFICECGNQYSHHSSLWKHRKKCKKEVPKDQDNLVQFLMKENTELKSMILEVCKNMKTVSNQNTFTTNNTNTNSNNNNSTFNLHFFLNETCKDAINLSEFVDTIKLELTDLENVGSKGFVVGISDIIIKNLKPLDITMRPVHCSDLKREVVYVKEADVWSNDTKESPENQKLKKAIKQITNKNISIIKNWKEKYQDCVYSNSSQSDTYNQIIGESMNYTSENSEKIIKKIAKEITIDKTILNK